MASGKAVVAAANNGYRTVLRDKGAEFLTPPGDVDILFEKLNSLVDQPVLRQELGDWGRNEAMKYDISNLVPEFEQVFQSALSERSKREAIG